MDSRSTVDLDVPEGAAGEEACLALREGEVLRASVHEVTPEGGIRLGLLGVQTWVRSEAALLVGQELELLVQKRGESVQLRILWTGGAAQSLSQSGREPGAETASAEPLDPAGLPQFHESLEEDEALRRQMLIRSASGALAALPIPASRSEAWTRSCLYFASDEAGEQLVLHLCPQQEGELRVDLHVGPSGVDLRAETTDRADLEALREMLPEFRQALSELGLTLQTGALRGGLGQSPAVMDLLSPRADGRPLLDERV